MIRSIWIEENFVRYRRDGGYISKNKQVIKPADPTKRCYYYMCASTILNEIIIDRSTIIV